MISGHPCRGRRPRRAAEGSRPLPTMWGDRGTKRKRTLTQGCGPGMPGPYRGGGRLAGAGRERRGRDESLPYGLREREIVGRPALRPPRACMGVGVVSGCLLYIRRLQIGAAEGSRPLPTMWKVRGWLWESVRAGHARPLRGGGGGNGCWPGGTWERMEEAACFQHPAHVNVENTCNFYLIIIV